MQNCANKNVKIQKISTDSVTIFFHLCGAVGTDLMWINPAIEFQVKVDNIWGCSSDFIELPLCSTVHILDYGVIQQEEYWMFGWMLNNLVVDAFSRQSHFLPSSSRRWTRRVIVWEKCELEWWIIGRVLGDEGGVHRRQISTILDKEQCFSSSVAIKLWFLVTH